MCAFILVDCCLFFICSFYVCLSCMLVLQEQATFQFQGLKLDKKDFFGKSDPFLTFSRSNEDGRCEDIYVMRLSFDIFLCHTI